MALSPVDEVNLIKFLKASAHTVDDINATGYSGTFGAGVAIQSLRDRGVQITTTTSANGEILYQITA